LRGIAQPEFCANAERKKKGSREEEYDRANASDCAGFQVHVHQVKAEPE